MTAANGAPRLTLGKEERLCSRTVVERLFAPGAKDVQRAMAYPVRAVWMPRTDGGTVSRMLVMVPKKRLRRAVDRVKMRRRIREAYRLQRPQLPPGAPACDIAFVYVADELRPYSDIARSLRRLLHRLP